MIGAFSMTLSRLTLRSLCLFAALPVSLAARAQSADSNATTDCNKLSSHTAEGDCRRLHSVTKTIYLANVTTQNDANEILVAVRNMFSPELKVYLIASQDAISISSYPEEIARIEAFIHELDRPRKLYRLTYTVAVSENGKNIGTQHYSLVASDGNRSTMKEGDKIPVATGSFSTDNAASQTQFTYLDVGMSFDATVISMANGVSLKSKVEQSSIGSTNTIAGVTEPVVRQSVLDGSSIATLGKPLMLGSIDIPNSTRHLDIDVMVEQIK
jgi:type II secretory pathway component GspD/PulD (secretin)